MEIPSDWTFKSSIVAKNFNDHVREQLPWYEMASGAVAHIARHYINENGLIYDIGGSTGNLGKLLEETLKARSARYVIIDNSERMRNESADFEYVVQDACEFDFQDHDISVMFLVLMFIDYKKRSSLLERIYDKLNPGGVFIIFDKLEPKGGYLSIIKHRLTMAGKLSAGASPDNILSKELSLCGVQRPINENLIYELFPHADQIFRFGEFAGWAIEKR